jgi:hypothetical protein
VRDNSARRIRYFPVAVIFLLLAVLLAGTASNLQRNPQPGLVAEGIPGQKVPSATSARLPSQYGPMVRQALADLDALTLPSGATLAGWDGPWRFVWPRDASFVAAARCSVGQYSEARGVLSFLNRVRPVSGRWAARYDVDGAVPTDGREPQLDGSGWVLWATWFCSSGLDLTEYWPMLRQSGDEIVSSLGSDGLPAASPDYWERPESSVTLGTIAPLQAGLRAGLAIADALGHEVPSWQAALDRLSSATDRVFGPTYPRTPGGGLDAIVTILGPPFAPPRVDVGDAIDHALAVLTQPNGGVTPGESWRADGVAWTPQTTLFALSAAARGDRATAQSLLSWLDSHRTPTGAIPEKVNRNLNPAGEAPLAWTSALVILTTSALDHPLPVPAA